MSDTTNTLGSPRSIEFRIHRVPIVRVISSTWEDALIQTISGDDSLIVRGTEFQLWTYSRLWTTETLKVFGDRMLDRERELAHQTGALATQVGELQADLERWQRIVLIERGRCELYREDLTRRDGFNRARIIEATFDERLRAKSPELFRVGER